MDATATRLRATANAMTREVAHKLGDRLANTPKRRREAGEARIEGRHLARTQKALWWLADQRDAGTLPRIFESLTTKKAVHELMRSHIDRSKGSYYDFGIDENRPTSSDLLARPLWEAIGAAAGPDITKAEGIRRKIEAAKSAGIPGYFPTPAHIVARMIEAAELPKTPFTFCEPQAGHGAIVDAVQEAAPHAQVTAYEINPRLREILTEKGLNLGFKADFLEIRPEKVAYDRILMNPPFERLQDAEHVRHAFKCLAVGGILVSIMSPAALFYNNSKALDFQKWFDAINGEFSFLPAGSFKESGTGVSTVMIVLVKLKEEDVF